MRFEFCQKILADMKKRSRIATPISKVRSGVVESPGGTLRHFRERLAAELYLRASGARQGNAMDIATKNHLKRNQQTSAGTFTDKACSEMEYYSACAPMLPK